MRTWLDERDAADVEAQPLQQSEVSGSPAAEAEAVPGRDRLGADPPQHRVGERLGLERCECLVEPQDEHVLDACVVEQLQAPLERRQQLDTLPEVPARMRVERDHRRPQVRGARGLEHTPVAPVDAVETADRDCPPRGCELLGPGRDDHGASTPPLTWAST